MLSSIQFFIEAIREAKQASVNQSINEWLDKFIKYIHFLLFLGTAEMSSDVQEISVQVIVVVVAYFRKNRINQEE